MKYPKFGLYVLCLKNNLYNKLFTVVSLLMIVYGVPLIAMIHYGLNKSLLALISNIVIPFNEAIFTPILEEIIFKSIFFVFLRKRLSFYQASIILSILFAGLHPMTTIFNFLNHFIIAFITFHLYQVYKTIFYPVLFHSIGNILTLNSDYFIGSYILPIYQNGNTLVSDTILCYIMAVALFTISSFTLLLKFKRIKEIIIFIWSSITITLLLFLEYNPLVSIFFWLTISAITLLTALRIHVDTSNYTDKLEGFLSDKIRKFDVP